MTPAARLRRISRPVDVIVSGALVLLLAIVPIVASVAVGTPVHAERTSGLPAVRSVSTSVTPARIPAPATSTIVNVSNDWAWTEWSSGVGPTPRSEPMMADDPAAHGVLLYGGTSLVTSSTLNDTWLYRAGAWTELCTGSATPPSCSASPSPRVGAQLAYSPAEGGVVLFGGTKTFTTVNDTWLFANGTWRNVSGTVAPPSGDGLPVATDPSGGVLLVTNRNHLAETWEFGPAGWSQQSPTTTPLVGDGQPMWLDAHLAADVLWDQGTGTWEFAGGQWVRLSVVGSPPGVGGIPLGGGYDSSFGYGFVYAPTDSDRTTWSFTGGEWRNVTANVSNGPPTTTPLGIAYDSSDGYVVAEEDVGASVRNVETWILHDPFTVRLNDSNAVRDVGQSASLYLTISGGISPYGYSVLSEPPGCGPPSNASNESAVPCVMTRTGTFSLSVLAHDVRDLYLTATLDVRVNPTLGASGYASPNPVTAGFPVTFSANISGGATPYAVAWTVPGQPSRSGPSFTTMFATAGTVEIGLVVTDSANSTWMATFPEVVVPALGVTASANRTSTDAGLPVGFGAVVQGGAPPATSTWSFGDGTTASGANVTHSFLSAGSFTVTVTAADSLVTTATSTVEVVVHAPLRIHPTGPTATVPVAGAPVPLSAGIWGGTPPFVIDWNFGDGQHSNVTDPAPTFASVGNTTVTEAVTDALGQHATGQLVLDVLASANGVPGGGSTGSDAGPWYASVGLVVVGAVAGAAVWFARRGRRPSA